jgi:hypothetical protein
MEGVAAGISHMSGPFLGTQHALYVTKGLALSHIGCDYFRHDGSSWIFYCIPVGQRSFFVQSFHPDPEIETGVRTENFAVDTP